MDVKMTIENNFRDEFEKIAVLPDGMRERVLHLLNNPEMGTKTIGEIAYSNGGVDKIKSNCCGTVAFSHHIDYDVFNVPRVVSNPYCFPAEGRPGFIDPVLFHKRIKHNFDKTRHPSPGDLVIINKVNTHPWFHHSAIYLKHSDLDFLRIFEQYGRGEKFQIRDMDWSKKDRKNYQVDYYRRSE